MNILYGISATGNGHISRSRILISALKKRGHNITVLFSGRDVKDLFDTKEFEPFIAKEGFTFKIKNGKVQYFSTLLNTNIYNFFYDIFKINNDYTNIDEQLEVNNVLLKPFSNVNFKKDLIESEGVITNAGFQLPSECIFLGKKLLCKPLLGQPEQEHNAKILSDLKLATTCNNLTTSTINDWIKNSSSRRIQYKNPVDLMIKIIENPEIDFSNEIIDIWDTNDNL